MRIIIAGDGETGCHLASMLSSENQDTVLMGTDRARLAELDATGNFITAEGSPLSIDDLLRVGTPEADLFVAVTPADTANILSCQLAKGLGVAKTVARIDNRELATGRGNDILKSLGVDKTIYPEMLAAKDIERFINHSWISEWFQLHSGELLVVGVRMHREGSLCGKQLRDIWSGADDKDRWFHVSAIRRGGRIIIPRGDNSLLEGDTVYFSVLAHNLEQLAPMCGRTVHRISRIMISGAGRVTENLLEAIGPRFDVTVVDPDAERCTAIAKRFRNVVVVNASASDVVTLKEEGVGLCDMFLALTGSSETNIVSCMVAREHGVKATLARIEELQYIPEAESLAIDKIINKKLLNTGNVLDLILDTRSDSSQSLSLDDAEISGFVAAENSRITTRRVSDLSLPREVTIGGLIRDGEARLVEGRTRILPGDHVVVFFVNGALTKVEKLFRQ